MSVFIKLSCCYCKSQGNLAQSLCNMNQCVHMLPSDLAVWKNTILSLCWREKEKQSAVEKVDRGVSPGRWLLVPATAALLPWGHDLRHRAFAVQVGKLHQARNKIVANASASPDLPQAGALQGLL